MIEVNMFGIKAKKDMDVGGAKPKVLFKTIRKHVLIVFMVLALSGSVLTSTQKEAEATFCIPCWACGILDCLIFGIVAELLQELIFTPIIEELIERHMNYEERWIVEVFFEELWVKGLAEMTHFLSAFGMYQVYMVGTFFDAHAQLDTQLLFNKLETEANRDYHPSDDFCWIGTAARSLVATEQSSKINQLALSQRSLKRMLGSSGLSGSANEASDKDSRWRQFIRTYCDPKDHGWNAIGTGLDLACDRDGLGGSAAAGALESYRINRDVDYTRLVEEPRTLDVDFKVSVNPTTNIDTQVPDDEIDVIAMANNLYGHDVLTRGLSRQAVATDTGQKLYYSLRSVAARRGVAENSFDAIIGLKSKGPDGVPAPDAGRFMAAVIRELMPPLSAAATPAQVAQYEQEVLGVLGENPSYYAQLEFLAKKIYQNPEFFANLYDTPANVDRKSVAMKAIELMLDRALFESELRQEMLMSVLLSNELRKEFKMVNGQGLLER